MGCFNKIGMISSLPIEINDETVLVFMQKNKYADTENKGGVVYPHDWFVPTFLPIFGTYDDYGRIENIQDSPVIKYIEEFFGKDIEKIIDEVDDISVGRGNSDEIKSEKNNELYQNLTFGLELKSVYDKLSSEFKEKNTKEEIKTYLKRSGRELKIDGIGFSDSMLGSILAMKSGIEYVDPADSFIDRIGIKDISDFISFNDGVSTLNAKYCPSNYGSQSQDHPLHYKMLTFYRNIIVSKLGSYEEPERILSELQGEIRDEKLSDILKC